ncbi:MAG: response regulator [Thermodesulfobacteriota bacterium]|jgi:DNA-binding response OmpR family regulator
MAESILNGKRILAVDDEPDVLNVLEEEIRIAAPKCMFEKATTYEEAAKKLESQVYDVVVLDIMGVRGFDLLDLAVKRNLQVAMLTAHSFSPESLKRSIDMKARAYLPKEKLGEIVPFLEDILEETDHLSGWARQMEKLDGFFKESWGTEWQKDEATFWKEFRKKIPFGKW